MRLRKKHMKVEMDFTCPHVFIMSTRNLRKRKLRSPEVKEENALSPTEEQSAGGLQDELQPKPEYPNKRIRRSMDDSSRQKRFTNKVRTGCIQCKKAHVKCDERKPKCSRCRRQGRPCTFDTPETWLFEPGQSSSRPSAQASRAGSTGNTPPSDTSASVLAVSRTTTTDVVQDSLFGTALMGRRASEQSSEQQNAFKSLYASLEDYDHAVGFDLGLLGDPDPAPSFRSTQVDRLLAISRLSLEEHTYLQYYLDTIVPVMARYVGNPYIWQHVFVQMLWLHPAVKYALVAFSMDYQTLERQASGMSPSPRLQPLGYFSRAVKALTEEHAPVEVVLVAGYLFWTSDMFHGRWTTVDMHIKSGLSIIAEARTRAEQHGDIVSADTDFIFTYMFGTLSMCQNFVEIQRSHRRNPGLVSVVRSKYHEQLESTSVAQVHRHIMVVLKSMKWFAKKLARSESVATAFQGLGVGLSTAVSEMEDIIVHLPLPFRTQPTLDAATNEHYTELFSIIYMSDDSVIHFCAVVDALNTLISGDAQEHGEDSPPPTPTLLTRIERLLPVFISAITSIDTVARDAAVERLKTARYITA